MSCDCTEKISSLIDGELPLAEAREVERHLLNCGECQQVRADFLNLRSQIIGLTPSVEHAVQRQALARILPPRSKDKARLGVGSQPANRGFSWRFSPAMGAVATFVVVGALIALFLYQRSDRQIPNAKHVAMQTASPVPSASVERNDEPKPTESKGPASGIEQSPRSKEDNESKTPRRTPASPVRRPSPSVREPRPGEQFATIPDRVRSADSETMTAMHFEKSELLLRAFRNVRLSEPGTAAEFGYERKRAQQLVYQNMILRREADAAGDVQVAALLESLEPILLDIANLPDDADDDAVSAIKARVERKNIVALLQVNSTALARALD